MDAIDQHVPEALSNTLHKLGLEDFYPNKLTLRSLLEISKDNVCDKNVSSLEEIPWCFLRKLLKINAECRGCTKLELAEDINDDPFHMDILNDDNSNKINPLDLIVALFLCADSFLQQQMALKMSMCQFSVPLLLPHGHKSQSGLMLWALRDIVKEWCPSELSETRGFVEESIVKANIPLFSFVRLQNCSLSKSLLLNHVLNKQNQNFFINREMDVGTLHKEIANGLVEVCWYLPCGRDNLDIFPEPVAFANLRGDICESLEQFNFLFQVSSATFVLLDKVEEKEQEMLTSLKDVRSKLFLVFNQKDGHSREDMMSVKTTFEKLHLPKNQLLHKDTRSNIAALSTKISAAIKKLQPTTKMSIEDISVRATELGLLGDESSSKDQKMESEKIKEVIGVRSITAYKKHQLPLQGENWKTLSEFQKRECRLNCAENIGLEHYKSDLQEKQKKMKEELMKYNLSNAMKIFLDNLSTSDKEHRDFFLKWMKLMLDTHSRKTLSTLRNQFKDQCKSKDAKKITELHQALLDSSLGIEHYMREMALIYEFSSQSEYRPALPTLAAEMLLDGYPLELLDGDVSNIPQRWVSAVLMELHQKVGGRSRLLVLTVLGVQSSGKSTLLNTMFGVQFPVSSGRCTRGAYMVLLRVGDDFKRELKYDFVVLIDTEGLKSPHFADLDDSYEHDNQLATFVIGLSDVTIINISMENSTEMKDVLQIAAHAFLRMNHVGKRPVCHFVHQNVGGVSAHSKCLGERKQLLEQLNEMTQIAAEMERQPSIKAFTDVIDYDVDKNNWYIPGLWNGTPPMAPVNTGYSEAVADFKKHVLLTVKDNIKHDVSQIPEFLEWMSSLWTAVKFENFIFSFRNTLVANAYDNLCKEFNQWEWEFKKEILSQKTKVEVEIHNTNFECNTKLNQFVASKKSEICDTIFKQEKSMKQKLTEYYKRKNVHATLIERYKIEFIKSIGRITNEIQVSTNNYLDQVVEIKNSSKEVQEIQKKHREIIEEQVRKLCIECKETTLTDEQLTDEFEKMWIKVTENVPSLKEQDISENIMSLLRKSFSNRKVGEELHNIQDLKEIETRPFKACKKHVKQAKLKNLFYCKSIKRDLQTAADNIIESCKKYVLGTVEANTAYNEFYTKELLEKVDVILKQNSKCNIKFEVDLKHYICRFATSKFTEMHKKFLTDNDPRTQVEKQKKDYFSYFLDQYKLKHRQERSIDKDDQSQQKAKDFVTLCIKPAVEHYINRSLGVNIVDEILKSSVSEEFTTTSLFQYNIQKELLQKEDFESLANYISNYEMYAKNWIFQHVVKIMSEDEALSNLKKSNLHTIICRIEQAIKMASKDESGISLPDNTESITTLISNMHKYLVKDISFSTEAEHSVLFQIRTTCHPFVESLLTSTHELAKELNDQFLSSQDAEETLNKLTIKPQDELFKRIFGCGKQCPFCKVPCQAGGQEHKHQAAVHRPQGLGGYRYEDSGKLVETLCTTDVQSKRRFRNSRTKGKWHPYKDYTNYYPDWHIPSDPTIEASDYWKFILVKYNEQFAEKYKAKPADVPEAWKNITKEQALKGLKDAFNITGLKFACVS